MRRVLWLFQVVLLSIACSAALASAADTPPELALTLDQHRFSPEELRVKANAPFVLVITNKDAAAAEFESKELRVEKVVPAGKTVKVRIRALKPGNYPFVNDFNQKTTGKIVAE